MKGYDCNRELHFKIMHAFLCFLTKFDFSKWLTHMISKLNIELFIMYRMHYFQMEIRTFRKSLRVLMKKIGY